MLILLGLIYLIYTLSLCWYSSVGILRLELTGKKLILSIEAAFLNSTCWILL